MQKHFERLTASIAALAIASVIQATTVIGASPGAPDLSFGSEGRVSLNLSVSTLGHDVVVQPDGKILVGGIISQGAGGKAFYVLRYNNDGSATDGSFGTNGVAIIDFGSNFENGGRLALQADGKILIAGELILPPSEGRDITVARLNSNGTPDNSFDGDGKVTLSISSTELELLKDIDIAPDGKIVLTDSLNAGLGLMRLNTNGSLDPTFSNDGVLVIDIAGPTDEAEASAIQADGKIVTAGSGFVSTAFFVVVRVNTNGTLDNTFSGNGVAEIPFTGNSEARSMEIQSTTGNIFVAGESMGGARSAIAKLLPNGTIDTAFGTAGKLELDLDPLGSEEFIGITIRPTNQRIVLLFRGQARNGLFRINASGNVVTSFGSNGTYSTDNLIAPSSIALQSDGKFVIVGTSGSSLLLTSHNNIELPTQSSDFDGDGDSDYAVFRPSNSTWFIIRSSDNSVFIAAFGANGDVPLDGDFDGDGRSDLAIYRPSLGQWWISKSGDGGNFAVTFGVSTDKPVPGDYDSDGKSDIAVFRPASGEWLILRSNSNNTTFFSFPFGANGDIPITRQGP